MSGFSVKPVLTKLVAREDLTGEEVEAAWDAILNEVLEPAAIGALLALIRAKGETPLEIAGMARAMKKACKPVTVGENENLLDIVGTGGDGADTINISTASAVLAAACGCKVAKCGNRSVSSACGSADVLEMLGVAIDLPPASAAACILSCGLGFLYAPVNHPAMRVVAPVRRAMGVRTSFNILGPITNAASANRVVIGVFEEHLVELLANALVELGHVEHGVVLHGCGLDEISPLGGSTICEIKNTAELGQPRIYEKKTYFFDPLSVGIQRCSVEDLKGGTPELNMREFRAVLGPKDGGAVEGVTTNGAKRDAVVLNTAMGLYVYGRAANIEEGVTIARAALDAGQALETLASFVQTSQSLRAQ